VAEIYRATDGRINQWRNLTTIAERARADAEAIHLAALRDWIDLSPKQDPHSVALLDAGKSLVE